MHFSAPLHVAYVDLKSAFDSVDRSALWQALQGILLDLLRDLHTGTGARFRVGVSVSDRFHTSFGVCQGCVLAPALFCRGIDWVMDNMTGLVGVEVGRDRFTDLDYADDIVLPVSDYDKLVPCLTQFLLSAGIMGLNFFWAKTKIQCLKDLARCQMIACRARMLSRFIDSATWAVCRIQMEEVDQTSSAG